MLDMNWKWKLNDKRTQDRYVDKGLLEKEKVSQTLKSLPDLAAQATWVEIDMEEGHLESVGSDANMNHDDSTEEAT